MSEEGRAADFAAKKPKSKPRRQKNGKAQLAEMNESRLGQNCPKRKQVAQPTSQPRN